jgi:hypothetical protein
MIVRSVRLADKMKKKNDLRLFSVFISLDAGTLPTPPPSGTADGTS